MKDELRGSPYPIFVNDRNRHLADCLTNEQFKSICTRDYLRARQLKLSFDDYMSLIDNF